MTKATDCVVQRTATSLARSIANGELSAVEVIDAHIRRIEEVNPALNAVVVPLFDQARTAAHKADERQARGEPLGKLHGVPITVKEMFDVEGTPTTAGLATRANHRATQDAVAVALLKRAGAIVLGKTNVPQLGMLPDSSNPLYGRTKNPWNADRTPGGSSGGEAAIIAVGGSPLGLGSDGGGSIRHPSHSCGICGFKPTGRRISFRGHWEAPNWSSEWLQPGPMARSVDDVWLALRAMQSSNGDTTELDVNATPTGDFRAVDINKFRVGFYTKLGWLTPSPAAERAVEEAADFFARDGLQVKPFNPPDVEEAWSLYFALFYADAFRFLKWEAQGNKLDWRVKRIFQFTQVPTLMRPFLSAVARVTGDHSVRQMLKAVHKRVLSSGEYTELLLRQTHYRQRFSDAMQNAGIDVLIGPPSPIAAVTPTDFYASYGLMYTGLFNLLAMPAGVVPATRVQSGEEHAARGRDIVDRSFAKVETGSAGLPIGVHVAARWWREDLTLAVMKRLEDYFQQTTAFPRTPLYPCRQPVQPIRD